MMPLPYPAAGSSPSTPIQNVSQQASVRRTCTSWLRPCTDRMAGAWRPVWLFTVRASKNEAISSACNAPAAQCTRAEMRRLLPWDLHIMLTHGGDFQACGQHGSTQTGEECPESSSMTRVDLARQPMQWQQASHSQGPDKITASRLDRSDFWGQRLAECCRSCTTHAYRLRTAAPRLEQNPKRSSPGAWQRR